MPYSIRKVAVLGAGTMGSGIAALVAGVGIPVLLMDIPANGTSPTDAFQVRNAPVWRALERLEKSNPPELYDPGDLRLISVGNTEDDLVRLAEVDWVIEVIIEKLDLKQALMRRILPIVRPDCIITTNTSGLPIWQIAEGLGEAFSCRFMGTHFFNPPRYLPLLELIPHPNADPALVDFMHAFLTTRLGKGVVIAKDEPNFIGNRFMAMLSSQTMGYALEYGLSVDEMDALTGQLIGRPKTGTFRLSDLVGNDVAWYVTSNLSESIPNDESRYLLSNEKVVALYTKLMQEKWLGNKSGQGFYKRVDTPNGREFWSLNLNTLEYNQPAKVRFDSVGKHRKVTDVTERIKRLMNEQDVAGRFLWHHHAFYLSYASKRVPEITDSLVNVDNAQKWGFAHQFGPFEIWDALGIAETVPTFEEGGYKVADWVHTMLANGIHRFYQQDERGQRIGYYSPQAGAYVPLAQNPRELTATRLRAMHGVVERNASANLVEMGDGILLLEMTTEHATIDEDFIQMGFKAVELLNQGGFKGMVISHDGERFSIGANILLMAMAVQSGDLNQLKRLVKGLQDFTMATRYAHAPIVTAPFNMALGGGAEILMAGVATVAHIELYTGLVEFGVGIIPGGSGTKEMMRRLINPIMRTKNADVLPHLRQAFEQIAFAKVSSSAVEAMHMGILRPTDRIVMNRAHLLSEAKRTALHLAQDYVPPRREKIYAAGRDAYSALLLAIDGLVRGKYASEHDALIAKKLAYIMTGGAPSEPTWLDEQVILDLELQALVELAQTPKTLERIAYMLQNNKPLRN